MARKKTAPPVGSTQYWENLLDQLNTKGGTGFIFPKAGRTRVRLVKLPKEEAFHSSCESEYQGNVRTKYMIAAFSLDQNADELDEGIRGLLVPKTVWSGIVGLLANGYDLWDPVEGHGLTIIRQGTGFDTNYSVIPSPKPVSLTDEQKTMLEEEERTLADLVEDYQEMNTSQSSPNGNSNSDNPEDIIPW